MAPLPGSLCTIIALSLSLPQSNLHHQFKIPRPRSKHTPLAKTFAKDTLSFLGSQHVVLSVFQNYDYLLFTFKIRFNNYRIATNLILLIKTSF